MSGCALVGMSGSDSSPIDHISALPAVDDSTAPAAGDRQGAEAGRASAAETRQPLTPEASDGYDEPSDPQSTRSSSGSPSSAGFSPTPAGSSPTDSPNVPPAGADARGETSEPLVQPWSPSANGDPWTGGTPGTPWTPEETPTDGATHGSADGGAYGSPEGTQQSPDGMPVLDIPSTGGEVVPTSLSPRQPPAVSVEAPGQPPQEDAPECPPGEVCRVEVEPSGQPPPREGPVVLYAASLNDDPTPAVKAAVLGIYLSFWENYWNASTHPVDPKGARLHLFAGEPILSRAKNVLSGRAAQGLALHFEDSHGEGRLVFIDKWAGGYAEIVDCIVDSASVYDVNTGAVLNDETATVVNRGLMYLTEAGWKVSEVFQQAIYERKEEGCVLQINDGVSTPADQQAGQETSQRGNQRTGRTKSVRQTNTESTGSAITSK